MTLTVTTFPPNLIQLDPIKAEEKKCDHSWVTRFFEIGKISYLCAICGAKTQIFPAGFDD